MRDGIFTCHRLPGFSVGDNLELFGYPQNDNGGPGVRSALMHRYSSIDFQPFYQRCRELFHDGF
jgi:hypothetical protein